MFPLVQEVQWLPEVQEVHGVQGNQELQQYQERPVEGSSEEHRVSHLSTVTAKVMQSKERV